MLVTHRQCMTPVAAGNTNPVTLISYSFVCLGFKLRVSIRSISVVMEMDALSSSCVGT